MFKSTRTRSGLCSLLVASALLLLLSACNQGVVPTPSPTAVTQPTSVNTSIPPAATVTIESVTSVQGDVLEGGVFITASLTLQNLNDVPASVTARFYDPAGKALIGSDGKPVEVTESVQPAGNNRTHKDVPLFMPFERLSLPQQGADVQFSVKVSTDDHAVNVESKRYILKVEWPYGRGG